MSSIFEPQLQSLEVTEITDDDQCDAYETDLNRLSQAIAQSTDPPDRWRERIQKQREKIVAFRLSQGEP